MVKEENIGILKNAAAGGKKSGLVYLTAFFGIAFIAVLFGSLFQLPEPPSAFGREGGSELLRYMIDHRETLLVQTYWRCTASFLMFLFIAGAVRIAYREKKELTLAGISAVGGAILFTALMYISQILNVTATLLAEETANADLLRALAASGDAMRHLNSFSAALMMGAATIYLREARVVPLWQTVFGLLSIPIFLVAAAGFPATGYEYLNLSALPYLPLFPLVSSIALLLGRKKNRRFGEGN